MYSVSVVKDSFHRVNGIKSRITTFELTFPRFILSEFNTHRVFSRNSASSRAIPAKKQIGAILKGGFVPKSFGTDIRGMQAGPDLAGAAHDQAVEIWTSSRNAAVAHAVALLLGNEKARKYTENPDVLNYSSVQDELLQELDVYAKVSRAEADHEYLNVHKQLANRILEPYSWHTVIVTSTEWDNFFALRANAEAQPEIQTIARMTLEAYEASTPQELTEGQWHLPLVQPDEMGEAIKDPEKWRMVSAGRCARVSYETHNNKRDTEADVQLFERLYTSGHMSPLEHVARPEPGLDENGELLWSGNFRGWHQWRKDFKNEDNFMKVLKSA